MAGRKKEEPTIALKSGSYAFCLAGIISKLNSKCLMYLLQDLIGSFWFIPLHSVASHADILRGSLRVPAPLVGQERVTNP